MSAAVPLRDDFDTATLRRLAKRSRDPAQLRRLLALAEIYDGATRSAAAEVGAVGLQTLRDWVLRFNAGGPAGLIDPKNAGRKSKLKAIHRQALEAVVEAGPRPAVDGIVRWRLSDLKQWVWEEFAIEISVQSLSRELRALDYRKLSARPCHPQGDPGAQEAFKKTSPPPWRRSQSKRQGVKT